MVMSYGEVIEFDSPQTLMSDPNSEFSSIVSEIKSKEGE
jgi:ABC-type multidrug transport system fused ATPase/permease subunit